MEGPTPVSALIHAATMVTAGVYLIARMHPLFEQAPAAADVGAIIGVVTLLVAGDDRRSSSTDLKRVIAYSTMSQIGYMIMGVCGGRLRRRHVPPDDARVLQGAAVHGGRLGHPRDGRRAEPGPAWAASARRCRSRSAASSSAAWRWPASPPFSGFFSKDEILPSSADRGGWHWVSYVVGYIAALLTAIYTFRMIFRAFFGEPCPEAGELEGGHLHHAEHPLNPATGEDRGHRRRLPRPGAPHRRARAAHEGGDGRAGACSRRRRLRPDPERDDVARQVPGADVRGLHVRSARRRANASGSGSVVGAVARARSASRSPTASGCAARGRSRSDPAALRRLPTRCSSTSGTSTS